MIEKQKDYDSGILTIWGVVLGVMFVAGTGFGLRGLCILGDQFEPNIIYSGICLIAGILLCGIPAAACYISRRLLEDRHENITELRKLNANLGEFLKRIELGEGK